MNDIQYVSEPSEVSMADEWFEIADLEHFWIRRRFDVFQEMIGTLGKEMKIADIGCGNGVIQKQLGELYGVQVDGFDLNEVALNASIAVGHNKYIYDVLEKRSEFSNKYDLIFLFDMLEHVEHPLEFIDAAAFMLKPKGILAINVPAIACLFSDYDTAAGHLRRYNKDMLDDLYERSNMSSENTKYWGLGLVPILLLRKIMLKFTKREKVIQDGFAPRYHWMNSLLYFLSRVDMKDGSLVGSSLMSLLKKIKE